MVKEKRINDKLVFICEVCGFGYLKIETAKKCEEWCKRTHSCSVEITKEAVYFPDPFEDSRV